jgi:hypothetical protein
LIAQRKARVISHKKQYYINILSVLDFPLIISVG